MALLLTKMIRLDLSAVSLPAGAGPLLQDHPIVRAVGGAAHVQEHNEIHYDTPTLQLYRHHVALTLNRRGEQWIQRCGVAEGSEQENPWVETPIPDQHLDLKAVRKVVAVQILSGNDARMLAPVFTLHCREQRWSLHFPGSASILLREERGYLKFGANRHPFHELVFEYQSGDLARWFQTALELAHALFLQEKSGVLERSGPGLVAMTPVDRGFAWLDPALLMSVLPTSPETKNDGSTEEETSEGGTSKLHPDMTSQQAFVSLCTGLLQQMQEAHSVVLYGGRQARLEGVRIFHQQTGRLQTLIALYDSALPKQVGGELRKEVGWLLKELSLVHECQILLEETIEPLREQFSTHPGLEDLLLKTKNALILAIKRLEKVLASFRYARLMLGLENWLNSTLWDFLSDSGQREVLERPVVRLAADWLQESHNQLRKQGRQWPSMSLASRCLLRPEIDQMVQAIDLFAEFFTNKRTKQAGTRISFRDALGRVQSTIHMLVHLQSSSRFLTRGVPTKEGSEPHPIQAWQEARIHRHMLDANREWEQFSNKLSFWY